MTMREIAAEVAIIRRRDAEAYDLALNEGRYEDVYKMDVELVRAVLAACVGLVEKCGIAEADFGPREPGKMFSGRMRIDNPPSRAELAAMFRAILSEGQK